MIPMSHLQVNDAFQEYLTTPPVILPDSHFDAEKQAVGGMSVYIDANTDQNPTNKGTSHSAPKHNHTKKTNPETNQLQGKMWREKIRVREREEKKKRLIEV